MEIEYTDLILASSEAGGYPLQWSPQGPAWKKTWSPRSPCGEVPAGKKSPLSHSCGAKKRPGESMIWHKFHIRGSWEFVIQFREPSNVEQKIMRKKKTYVQDILSRLHHRASKVIHGPCPKSQSWPLSSMTYFDPNGKTFLKCFVYVHSDWPAECGLIPMSLSHVMWLEKYVCIYIWLFMCTKQSL